MRFFQSFGFVHAGDFARYCTDAFDRLWREGAKAPKMMTIGQHLRITGRPGRMAGLEHAAWRRHAHSLNKGADYHEKD